MKIGNTKVNFKFKVGWKESSKKERIIAILSYLIIALIIIYLIIYIILNIIGVWIKIINKNSKNFKIS